MFAKEFIAFLGLATLGLASPSYGTYPPAPKDYPCGKLNFIFTGLPPFHPLVAAQGFDPNAVSAAMAGDIMNITKAGYNIKTVLVGPEDSLDNLSNGLAGTKWDGVGVGYGLRGSRLANLTVRFEDTVELYRERSTSRILFNNAPNAALWAIQRNFPISKDCSNTPGKNLGYEVYCSACPPNSPKGPGPA